jgi:hypothetical protein
VARTAVSGPMGRGAKLRILDMGPRMRHMKVQV